MEATLRCPRCGKEHALPAGPQAAQVRCECGGIVRRPAGELVVDLSAWEVPEPKPQEQMGTMGDRLRAFLAASASQAGPGGTLLSSARLRSLLWGAAAVAAYLTTGTGAIGRSDFRGLLATGAPRFALLALCFVLGAGIGSACLGTVTQRGLGKAAPWGALVGMVVGFVWPSMAWTPGGIWAVSLIVVPPALAAVGLLLGGLAGTRGPAARWVHRGLGVSGCALLVLLTAYATLPQRYAPGLFLAAQPGSVWSRILAQANLALADNAVNRYGPLSCSKDPEVASEALLELAMATDPLAIPYFARALESRDGGAASAAVIGLVRLRDPRAQAILDKVGERTRSTVEWITTSGAYLRPEEARQILERGLTGERKPAANALADFGGPEDAPVLLGLLQDPDPSVRASACRGVARVRAPSAVTALLAAGRDRDGQVRTSALSGLCELGDPRGLPLVLDAVRKGDYDTPELAIGALTHFRDPRAAAAMVQMLPVEKGRSDDGLVGALRAMGEPALGPLIAASAHPDYRVRGPVVRALEGFSDPRARAAIIRAERIVDDGALRAAVEEVGWDRGEAIIRTTLRAIRLGSPELRDWAEKALGDAYARGNKNGVVVALKDPDARIRVAAVRAIGRGYGSSGVTALAPLLNDPREQVRVEVCRALGRAQSLDGREALEQALLTDRSPAVRAGAAVALSDIRASDGEKPLLAALRREQDPGARLALVAALGEYRDESVTEALLALYPRAPVKLQAAALKSLRHRDDPRAEALLQKSREQEVRRARQQLGQ